MDHVAYDFPRREMLKYVPRYSRRILDVGCASGLFGAVLREAMPHAEIWGVDPRPTTGQARSYDRIVTGRFPDDIDASITFDCVVFNDVLEHMVDPWAAVRQARSLLSHEGIVVASLPSIRNFRTLRELLVEGQWRYRDRGVLDRTHLRFFTEKSMHDLFRSSGYTVSLCEPINLPIRGRQALACRWSRGRLNGFVAEQFALVAVPNARPSVR